MLVSNIKKEYHHVLQNVSLAVKAGEYIALVGFSGVGKTTLCSLIPRFYEVNDGEILLDGIISGRLAYAPCVEISGLCSKTSICSPAQLPIISAMVNSTPVQEEIIAAAKKPMPMISSWPCPMGMRRILGNGASNCRADKSKG